MFTLGTYGICVQPPGLMVMKKRKVKNQMTNITFGTDYPRKTCGRPSLNGLTRVRLVRRQF
eukprot:4756881-Prorocentrum_lima.AAC.1